MEEKAYQKRADAPNTIRSLFDQVPEPGNAESFSEDSLQFYLKQMNAFPVLSPEDETEYWHRVEDSLTEIRKNLSCFGFLYQEYAKLLSDEMDDPEDIFLSGAETKYALNPQKRKEWLQQLRGIYSELKDAFETNSDALEKARAHGAEFIQRHPVLQDKLLEWVEVAGYYQLMLNAGRCTEKELTERTLCTPEEFRERLAKIRKSQAEYENWRQKLVECNLRLVIHLAKPYQNCGIPFSDLIQEGNIGLLKAFDKFNFKLGHRFGTYAKWWIRQGIIRAISAQSRIIRLPAHMIAAIRKIKITEKNLIQKTGEEPTDAQIAQVLEMPVERVRAIRRMAVQTLSLQASENETKKASLEDYLEVSENDDPMKVYARKIVQERLEKALNELPERERIVLNMRYGLDGTPGKSLAEISEVFHVTRERIRQIEIRTLEKLKNNSESGRIFDDFFI